MDAHLAAASRNGQAQPAHPVNRHTLLAGAGIGMFVTGVPAVLVAAGGGGILAKDETSVLMVVAIIWAAALQGLTGQASWRSAACCDCSSE